MFMFGGGTKQVLPQNMSKPLAGYMLQGDEYVILWTVTAKIERPSPAILL